jgi:hypothetical protein
MASAVDSSGVEGESVETAGQPSSGYQRFVGNRFDGDGLFQKPIEQLAPAAPFAPVEAECELVEKHTTGCGHGSQVNIHQKENSSALLFLW